MLSLPKLILQILSFWSVWSCRSHALIQSQTSWNLGRPLEVPAPSSTCLAISTRCSNSPTPTSATTTRPLNELIRSLQEYDIRFSPGASRSELERLLLQHELSQPSSATSASPESDPTLSQSISAESPAFSATNDGVCSDSLVEILQELNRRHIRFPPSATRQQLVKLLHESSTLEQQQQQKSTTVRDRKGTARTTTTMASPFLLPQQTKSNSPKQTRTSSEFLDDAKRAILMEELRKRRNNVFSSSVYHDHDSYNDDDGLDELSLSDLEERLRAMKSSVNQRLVDDDVASGTRIQTISQLSPGVTSAALLDEGEEDEDAEMSIIPEVLPPRKRRLRRLRRRQREVPQGRRRRRRISADLAYLDSSYSNFVLDSLADGMDAMGRLFDGIDDGNNNGYGEVRDDRGGLLLTWEDEEISPRDSYDTTSDQTYGFDERNRRRHRRRRRHGYQHGRRIPNGRSGYPSPRNRTRTTTARQVDVSGNHLQQRGDEEGASSTNHHTMEVTESTRSLVSSACDVEQDLKPFLDLSSRVREASSSHKMKSSQQQGQQHAQGKTSPAVPESTMQQRNEVPSELRNDASSRLAVESTSSRRDQSSSSSNRTSRRIYSPYKSSSSTDTVDANNSVFRTMGGFGDDDNDEEQPIPDMLDRIAGVVGEAMETVLLGREGIDGEGLKSDESKNNGVLEVGSRISQAGSRLTNELQQRLQATNGTLSQIPFRPDKQGLLDYALGGYNPNSYASVVRNRLEEVWEQSQLGNKLPRSFTSLIRITFRSGFIMLGWAARWSSVNGTVPLWMIWMSMVGAWFGTSASSSSRRWTSLLGTLIVMRVMGEAVNAILEKNPRFKTMRAATRPHPSELRSANNQRAELGGSDIDSTTKSQTLPMICSDEVDVVQALDNCVLDIELDAERDRQRE